MFDLLQSDSERWKGLRHLRLWVGLPGAFTVGLLVGLLWAGGLPFDAIRITCVTGLLILTILSVALFNRESKPYSRPEIQTAAQITTARNCFAF
jgi:uncharacterized membrane protein (DUF441 family)